VCSLFSEVLSWLSNLSWELLIKELC
jgi:hypothetical protein